jgi:membrane protein
MRARRWLGTGAIVTRISAPGGGSPSGCVPMGMPKMGLGRIWRLFKAALAGWWNDNVPRLGASLAYYTLFAIAPILVVAIAIAGLVFGGDAVRAEVVGQVDELVGPVGAQGVNVLLEGADREEAGILATVLGSITFVLTSTGAFLELQAALNNIWRVKPNPAVSVKSFLFDRLISFGLVIAVGFLLLVSLLVSAALAAAGRYVRGSLPDWIGVANVGSVVLSFVVITLLFALVYKVLPDVKLRWRDVWVGGAVTALLFTVGKFAIGLYLGHSSTSSTYGAAGSIVVLLVWVYYASQVVLLGAEFTRVFTEDTVGRRPLEEHAVPEPAAAGDASMTTAGHREGEG